MTSQHTVKRALGSALAAIVVATASPAAAQVNAPESEILLIGSSFVRGIKPQLERLFASIGIDAKVTAVGPAGFTLGQHAKRGDTLRTIRSRRWDYVILQEQSNGAGPTTYVAARELHKVIAANGSKTGFMMTWRDRHMPLSSYDSLRGNVGGSYGYVPIAFELNAPVAPVGWAVRGLVEDGAPIDVWSRDGHHLGLPGEYLAACTLFATLTGGSPVGLAAPAGMSPTVARYLQEVANDVTLPQRAQWNIR